MKLSITGSSQKVKDILTADQIEIAERNRNTREYSQVIIQNDSSVSTEAVYVEFGQDAVIGESLIIALDGALSFEEVDIGDINIISATGANSIIIAFN